MLSLVPGRVTVVIPSRYERWLQQTIDDVFKKAAGDVEVRVCLDGYWPDPLLKDDPRLHLYHPSARVGMRGGINACVAMARGQYILKLDGHCLVGEGFDEVLKNSIDADWIMIPRRESLDVGPTGVEKWDVLRDKPPKDAHFLSYPFERKDDKMCGLHGNVWDERRKQTKDLMIADEMSSQGSCYFMHTSYWRHAIGSLDELNYGPFHQEFQEVGNKCWLSGGRVVTNRGTFYAHLHKGKLGTNYKYSSDEWKQWAAYYQKAHDYTIDAWLGDKLTGWAQVKRIRPFRWLVEHFWEAAGGIPTWPKTSKGELDWDFVMREYAEWSRTRNG